jgi:hypothetical protein
MRCIGSGTACLVLIETSSGCILAGSSLGKIYTGTKKKRMITRKSYYYSCVFF